MRILRIYPSNGAQTKSYEDVEEIIPGARESIAFKLKSGLAVSVSRATDWVLLEKADDETADCS